MSQMMCCYCGQIKEDVSFVIGACRSDDPAWTMWEGTGKISCPNCDPKGREESRLVIERF